MPDVEEQLRDLLDEYRDRRGHCCEHGLTEDCATYRQVVRELEDVLEVE